jgi:hypothetical protein
MVIPENLVIIGFDLSRSVRGCVPAGPGLCHPTGAEAVALRRELAPSFQPSPATNEFLVDFNGI